MMKSATVIKLEDYRHPREEEIKPSHPPYTVELSEAIQLLVQQLRESEAKGRID